MKCEVCNKEYEGRGKVCNACRMKKSRLKEVTQEPSVTKATVKVKAGLCHGCNEPQENLKVCICHICIAKGATHEKLGLPMCSDTSNYDTRS